MRWRRAAREKLPSARRWRPGRRKFHDLARSRLRSQFLWRAPDPADRLPSKMIIDSDSGALILSAELECALTNRLARKIYGIRVRARLNIFAFYGNVIRYRIFGAAAEGDSNIEEVFRSAERIVRSERLNRHAQRVARERRADRGEDQQTIYRRHADAQANRPEERGVFFRGQGNGRNSVSRIGGEVRGRGIFRLCAAGAIGRPERVGLLRRRR